MEHPVTAVKSALTDRPLRSSTASFAKSAVDALTQRQIASLLLKRDASRTQNPRLILEDLDQVSQQKYLEAASLAIRCIDDTFHIPALYAGVDAGDRYEGGDGLGSMVKDVRMHQLGRFETELRTYRKALASDDPAQLERFRKLAEADRQ